jgi:hypothetical protein
VKEGMPKRKTWRERPETGKQNPAANAMEYFVLRMPAFHNWLEAVGAFLQLHEPCPKRRTEIEAGLVLFRNWEAAPDALKEQVIANIPRLLSDPRTFLALERLGIITRFRVGKG